MRTTAYILLFFLVVLSCPAQEILSTYHGMVTVKANKVEKQGNNLELEMSIELCGLSVGRYQTLSIIPMLRAGRDSLQLQPIVVNGANKQKMYERTFSFKGQAVADDGAYIVLKNEPKVLRQVNYRATIPCKSWMKGSEFILVGRFNSYDGKPQQAYYDILTNRLNF